MSVFYSVACVSVCIVCSSDKFCSEFVTVKGKNQFRCVSSRSFTHYVNLVVLSMNEGETCPKLTTPYRLHTSPHFGAARMIGEMNIWCMRLFVCSIPCIQYRLWIASKNPLLFQLRQNRTQLPIVYFCTAFFVSLFESAKRLYFKKDTV